jgi:alpha-ribazole phosphatase
VIWLITGGSFQGKHEYVKRFPSAQTADWLTALSLTDVFPVNGGTRPDRAGSSQVFVIEGIVDLLDHCLDIEFDSNRHDSEDSTGLSGWLIRLRRLGANHTVFVIQTEMGQGVVPIGERERRRRDLNGRLSQRIAALSGYVVRLFCGLPEVLKEPAHSVFATPAFSLYLIRHGETGMNRERRYLGQMDVPLDEPGRQAIQELTALGHFPKLDYYVSSPLRRCLQTAKIIYPDMEPRLVDPRFIERDFGEFEGERFEELILRPEYVEWLDGQGAGKTPGGESQEEIQVRLRAGWSDLIKSALNEEKAAGGRLSVGLIAHGGVIMELMKSLGFTDYYSWQLTNGSWIQLFLDRRGRLVDIPPRIGGGTVGRAV